MKIAILGCGNMGLAYARSFLKYDLVTTKDLLLIEKDTERQKQLDSFSIGTVVSNITPNTLSGVDVLILSIKPQDFESIKEKLKIALNPSIIIVSIMAGKTLSFLSSELNHTNMVRAMPNSPAIVGMGITAYVNNNTMRVGDLRKVDKILNATGRSIYLENENLMNAVTALSGSGPAYFFYIVKNMILAGIEMGLDAHSSTVLVQQTLLGSYHLMNAKEANLNELIKNVASKGGTTEAALNYFENNALNKILIDGIKQAENRGKELAMPKSQSHK